MSERPKRLERKTYYATKIKRAVQLLFYKRHREPGMKGWELRRKLGSDYPKIVSLLDDYLDKLGLTVKTIFDENGTSPENPTLAQLDKARFYVTLKKIQSSNMTKLVGWRIDDLAGLAVSLGFIISKGGKVTRKDLANFLKIKLPGWRVNYNLDQYIRVGYLVEDENEQLFIGWRTRAEIDQKKLIDLLLSE